MKSDIQIAKEAILRKAKSIGEGIGIAREKIQSFGRHMAKVPIDLIDQKRVDKSNLVLVTAITPTKAGVGKTTVSIGLALGLNKIGKNAIVTLREPSLGPVWQEGWGSRLWLFAGASYGEYQLALHGRFSRYHFCAQHYFGPVRQLHHAQSRVREKNKDCVVETCFGCKR